MQKTDRPERGVPQDPELALALQIARWLDQRYLEPVVGLFLPGAGDLLGATLGMYTLNLARRRGAPRIVLARMLLNLALDMVGGAIPLAGDLWDFWFQAHTRNAELLRAHLQRGVVRSTPGDWLVLAGAVLAFAAALAVPIGLLIWVVRGLWS